MNHTEQSALKALSKKRDVRVDKGQKVINVVCNQVATPDGMKPNPNKRNDLGNSSWGKIDYLVKEHDYVIIKVEKISNDKVED